MRSTGVTRKCDRSNRESESLKVCKFEKARKFTSSQVCAQKTQKIQKTLLNESGQFDNECSSSLLLPDDGLNTQRGNQDNSIQQSNKSWKILTGRPFQGF